MCRRSDLTSVLDLDGAARAGADRDQKRHLQPQAASSETSREPQDVTGMMPCVLACFWMTS